MGESGSESWKPTANHALLRARAQLLRSIREFFYERDVMEVDTPLLCQHGVTELHTPNLLVKSYDGLTHMGYLQTSPEYAMKRLLAAGSGSIYQITKAFRADEESRLHNPEFSMLEWYRVNFDMNQLMDDVDELLLSVMNCTPARRFSYQECFAAFLDLDPFHEPLERLQLLAKERAGYRADPEDDRDVLLQVLFVQVIEPHLGFGEPCFIYHYPSSQASLAVINEETPEVANRFELFFNGIEMANGFQELLSATEQRERFIADNIKREAMNLPPMVLDGYLLQALSHGMPPCSGIALGIDRLLMAVTQKEHITDVLAFPYSRA